MISTAPIGTLRNWSQTLKTKYSLDDPPNDEEELRQWLIIHAEKEDRYKFHNIPAELKNLQRWVCWRQEEKNEKLTKIPYNISTHERASSTEPKTWGGYEDAIVAFHKHNYDGIGFMFYEQDGYIGLDWDHIRDPVTGTWNEESFLEILSFSSYAEISPSHSGAHCIIKGRKPGDKCRRGNYEMYSKDRYFTFTGFHIEQTPKTVNVAKPELIEAFYSLISDGDTVSEQHPVPSANELTDDEIIKLASNAVNGDKFKALFRGDWSGRYPSQSEAEEAFCFLLVFYTRDISQIDRLMRRSKLFRDKWNRDDYRGNTIANALKKITESYSPSPERKQPGFEIPPQNEKNLTDFGNCERFVNLYGFDVKYCKVFDQWYIWTEHEGRWKRDTTGYIQEYAKSTVRSIYGESERNGEEVMRRRLARWAIQCETTSHVEAMLKLARSERVVVVEHDAFDTNPFLLNLKNGVYDLHNHTLVPHRKDLLMSRLCPVSYIQDATCPKWLKFLERIFKGRSDREEIISFLQRFLGYCLTGSIEEQVLLLLYGAGENGKSVLLNVISKIHGDYASTAEAATFTTARSDAVRNDLARLDGARVVTAIEANKSSVIDESVIKQITGGDVITARFLFKELFEYRPQFKLLWAFNHKPVIRDSTHSIWRRILLLPFEEKIASEERILGLDNLLVNEEGPGILNWMIEGLKEYQAHGLRPPSSIVEATKEYRNDSDILFDFINEMLITNDEQRLGQQDCRVSAATLYDTYTQWCAHNNEKSMMGRKKFFTELLERGYKRIKMNSGNFYVGISVRKFGGEAHT